MLRRFFPSRVSFKACRPTPFLQSTNCFSTTSSSSGLLRTTARTNMRAVIVRVDTEKGFAVCLGNNNKLFLPESEFAGSFQELTIGTKIHCKPRNIKGQNVATQALLRLEDSEPAAENDETSTSGEEDSWERRSKELFKHGRAGDPELVLNENGEVDIDATIENSKKQKNALFSHLQPCTPGERYVGWLMRSLKYGRYIRPIDKSLATVFCSHDNVPHAPAAHILEGVKVEFTAAANHSSVPSCECIAEDVRFLNASPKNVRARESATTAAAVHPDREEEAKRGYSKRSLSGGFHNDFKAARAEETIGGDGRRRRMRRVERTQSAFVDSNNADASKTVTMEEAAKSGASQTGLIHYPVRAGRYISTKGFQESILCSWEHVPLHIPFGKRTAVRYKVKEDHIRTIENGTGETVYGAYDLVCDEIPECATPLAPFTEEDDGKTMKGYISRFYTEHRKGFLVRVEDRVGLYAPPWAVPDDITAYFQATKTEYFNRMTATQSAYAEKKEKRKQAEDKKSLAASFDSDDVDEPKDCYDTLTYVPITFTVEVDDRLSAHYETLLMRAVNVKAVGKLTRDDEAEEDVEEVEEATKPGWRRKYQLNQRSMSAGDDDEDEEEDEAKPKKKKKKQNNNNRRKKKKKVVIDDEALEEEFA